MKMGKNYITSKIQKQNYITKSKNYIRFQKLHKILTTKEGEAEAPPTFYVYSSSV
tara:strand:- start:1643 stop:1807 length:165 start_codon:yes stop_codon:yes gene_type:complete